jgi:signal transduction histidine kinase
VKSIRSFLLKRLLGGAALVLVLAGAVVCVVVTRSLEGQFDENLSDRIQALSSLCFQTASEVQFEFSDQLMPEYGRDARPDYFELRYEDGRLLEGSDSLHGAALSVPAGLSAEPARWSAPLPDGRPGRFAAQLVEVHHVYPEEGPDRPTAVRLSIAIAAGREDLVAAERSVLGSCAAACLVLVGLLALLSRLAVDRALEPANRLAAALDAIRVEGVPDRPGSEWTDRDALPAELAPIARKIDALIGRIDTAFRRERRTSADIAHELRTPISELVAVSDVALLDGRDPESSRRALATMREIAWRMGRTVSTLLKLARLEMGAEACERRAVDLGLALDEAFRAVSSVGAEREVEVRNRVEPGSRVLADGDVLRIVLSNLVGNAVEYSPRGGTVECRLERGEERWSLVVENDAPELSPEDLASLSEPFWRKDRARTDRNRSGLGLALSRALVEQTGLRLEFQLEGRRFRASLSGVAFRPTDSSAERIVGDAPTATHRST